MGIGKEAIVALEQLAAQSVRIYDDACDVGVWETPAIRNAIRRALFELRDLEGGTAHRGLTFTAYRTRLGYERDGATVSGVAVCVTRNYDRRSGRYWFDFQFSPATWPVTGGNVTLRV